MENEDDNNGVQVGLKKWRFRKMKKENEEEGWKNHSSEIGVTHKVVFLDKPISWITQVTKKIHSHTLKGD